MKLLRIIKWVFMVLVPLFLLSACYEQYALYNASKLPLDGEYIQINGHKTHVIQKGEGKVPVVFVSGWDVMGHLSWENIQDEMAKQTYTISYDRAGMLRSESSDKPRTCTNISEELHEILEKKKVAKPYVLVAHSLGGAFVRCLIKNHKDEVAGVVLVDSAHPNQIKFYEKEIQKRMKNLPAIWLVKLQSYSGLARAYNYLYGRDIPYIKKDDIRNLKKRAFVPKGYVTYIREGKHFMEMSQEINGTTFANIPLIVLSSTQSKETQGIDLKDWKKLQNELAGLSTNSKHLWINAGHYIQLEKPKVVVTAIKEVLGEIEIRK